MKKDYDFYILILGFLIDRVFGIRLGAIIFASFIAGGKFITIINNNDG